MHALEQGGVHDEAPLHPIECDKVTQQSMQWHTATWSSQVSCAPCPNGLTQCFQRQCNTACRASKERPAEQRVAHPLDAQHLLRGAQVGHAPADLRRRAEAGQGRAQSLLLVQLGPALHARRLLRLPQRLSSQRARLLPQASAHGIGHPALQFRRLKVALITTALHFNCANKYKAGSAIHVSVNEQQVSLRCFLQSGVRALRGGHGSACTAKASDGGRLLPCAAATGVEGALAEVFSSARSCASCAGAQSRGSLPCQSDKPGSHSQVLARNRKKQRSSRRGTACDIQPKHGCCTAHLIAVRQNAEVVLGARPARQALR